MNVSPTYFAIEDYDTWLRIAKITNRFAHIPKALGAYQLHDGNIGKINNFQYLSNALQSYLDELDKMQLRRYQSLYIYQIARNDYRGKRFNETTGNLIFVIRFGRVSFTIRALAMLFSNMILRGIFPKISYFKR